MFLVAYTAARINVFSVNWKPTAFFKRTLLLRLACADGPFDDGACTMESRTIQVGSFGKAAEGVEFVA